MKTKPIELIVISTLICIVVIIALLCVSLIVPLSSKMLLEYHVLFDAILFILLFILLSSLTTRVASKIHPLEADTFNMLSGKAFHWKLITSLTEMGGMFFLPLVPLFLKPLFFSLFGARIGKNAEIAGTLIDLPLITIEEYAFIGGGALITAHAITHDSITLKPIKIAARATIGIGAIIMPGVFVGENSVVAPGAVVLMDTVIPPNEFWGGVPARKIKSNESAE